MANKVTQTAGLICNVNTVKNKLKEFYESQGIVTPMFSGGHTAMTATLQKILKLILKECANRVGKDKSGVKSVNRESVQYSVLLHPGFNRYFLVELNRFEQTQLYKDQVPISHTEMDAVIASVDPDLSLTPKARNMVCYLLLRVFSDIAYTCSLMLEFSKKKSLDARCVMFAIASKFPDTISQELKSEVARVAKLFGDELEDNSGMDTAEEGTKQPAADLQVAVVEEADGGEEVDTTKKKDNKSAQAKTKENKPQTADAKVKNAAGTKTKNTQLIDEDANEPDEEPAEDEPVVEVAAPEVKAKPAANKSNGNKPNAAAKPNAATKPAATPQKNTGGKSGAK